MNFLVFTHKIKHFLCNTLLFFQFAADISKLLFPLAVLLLRTHKVNLRLKHNMNKILTRTAVLLLTQG